MTGKHWMLVRFLPAQFLIACIESINKSDTGHQTATCLARCRISIQCNGVKLQAEPTSYLSQPSPPNRSLPHEKIVDSTPNNEDVMMDTIICTMLEYINTYDHISSIASHHVHQINEYHIVLLYHHLQQ